MQRKIAKQVTIEAKFQCTSRNSAEHVATRNTGFATILGEHIVSPVLARSLMLGLNSGIDRTIYIVGPRLPTHT